MPYFSLFYLAKFLEKPIKTKMNGFCINPTTGGTNKSQVNKLEQKMSRQLGRYIIKVNAEKTENKRYPDHHHHHLPRKCIIIRQRRLYCLEHLMKLDRHMPVRLALYESLLSVQR